jgi:multiple sugar transport system permease protein
MMAGYGDDVSALNEAAGTRFVNWNAFYVLPRDFLVRAGQPDAGLFSRAVDAFQADQPVTARYYFSPEGFFKNGYLKTRYGKDLAGYNREHGTAHASWSSVILDAEAPAGSGRTELERADWELFVRSILNLLWIRAAPEAAPLYRDYLRAKYGTLENLNRRSAARYESFDHVDFPEIPPETGIARTDWEAFLQGWEDPANGRLHLLPAEQIRIDSMETRFRRHLQQEFDSLDSLNARLGTAFSDWNQIRPPQAETHYRAFRDQRTALRVEFALRNYYSVLDYLVLHGRGLVNTAIYCLLAILSALIVNPLAAYALSRFRPPSTYRVLLFLMLTMSFPPMVTQIPVFLMLREFNLLNTFWALILPGLANGYSIFLLKGFFDSLPRELYESADMDGAGELRMFWHITMSLSTPILAVIALQAFTHAYANFMMALLICQEEKMWTLMPWLYQLQQRSGPGIIYASLVIAAAPTFLVFAICQKIILRGIVVPVEK